jgi:predicted Zn finger-like uncharacterized protein
VAGDGLSGARVVCPSCAAEFLLPAAHLDPRARIRCPDCGGTFRAYDPAAARAFAAPLARWAAARPGGLVAVRAARAEGRFFAAHGAALAAAFGEVERAGGSDPGAVAAFQAALAELLGPGTPLFG